MEKKSQLGVIGQGSSDYTLNPCQSPEPLFTHDLSKQSPISEPRTVSWSDQNVSATGVDREIEDSIPSGDISEVTVTTQTEDGDATTLTMTTDEPADAILLDDHLERADRP